MENEINTIKPRKIAIENYENIGNGKDVTLEIQEHRIYYKRVPSGGEKGTFGMTGL